MSPENIVTINRIYEAFENRDTAMFFSFLSSEIHVTQCPQVPWGGVFQGLEEAKVFFGKLSAYLDDHVAIEHIIDIGDRIAVIGRGQGTIRDTKTPFDVPIMHLWVLKDELAVRLEIVLDVPTMQAALQRSHASGGVVSLFNKRKFFEADGMPNSISRVHVEKSDAQRRFPSLA